MRAGNLRHEVAIQSRSTSQDEFGQPVETWSTVATVWASIDPISGREFIGKSGEAAQVSHRVVMRHTAVTPAHRILFGSRVFDVQHVGNYRERNEFLELLCAERVA